jgi:hypothetical protein
LTEGGIPIVGAQVFVLDRLTGDTCATSKFFGETDQNGNFMVRGRTKMRLTVVMGDPLEMWGVCISRNGEIIEGWRSTGIGIAPARAYLDCDVSRPKQESKDGKGLCTVERL